MTGSCSTAPIAGLEEQQEVSSVVYRAGDVVYVRGASGGVWVAILIDSVLRTWVRTSSGGYATFSSDRPRCRYFVPTTELWTQEHSVVWWSARGSDGGLRLESEDEAVERAAQSSGIHFSYEGKRDWRLRHTHYHHGRL